MVRVAVAGGTGALGKTFVNVLSQSHHVLVLSRSARQSTNPNITYAQVDYTDIPGTATLLTTHAITTIISAIAIEDAASAHSQQNLTRAAALSATVTRFIPSEYGHVFTPANTALSPLFQLWQDNVDVLAQTALEWTRVRAGFFMDYYGMPRVASTLKPFVWAVDVGAGKAVLPGDGEVRLSMTYTPDLAEFLSRLVGDERAWPRVVNVSGQDFTFNQLVGWAEEVRGTKFEVAYDGVEVLERGDATVLPQGEGEYPPETVKLLSSLFGLLVVRGDYLLPKERLNEWFSDVRVTTMEALLKKAWSK